MQQISGTCIHLPWAFTFSLACALTHAVTPSMQSQLQLLQLMRRSEKWAVMMSQSRSHLWDTKSRAETSKTPKLQHPLITFVKWNPNPLPLHGPSRHRNSPFPQPPALQTKTNCWALPLTDRLHNLKACDFFLAKARQEIFRDAF
ncbi:hypothetical protein CDAR_106981 [Caerostris darwini]|uniref:Secreted protein n=1 Tax=Caerostris darwini TaxID=1538125 RepID=A0AAV4SYE1_9ARAC|nr:hypothetical protein CDAR_106981 [Caerostris darwini]